MRAATNPKAEAFSLDEVFSLMSLFDEEEGKMEADSTPIPKANMQCSSADFVKEPPVSIFLREDFKRWGLGYTLEKEFSQKKTKDQLGGCLCSRAASATAGSVIHEGYNLRENSSPSPRGNGHRFRSGLVVAVGGRPLTGI